MSDAPIELRWNDAPRRLLHAADELLAASPAVVIAVTGAVGAGKSTLARLLSPCVLATDNYLPDHAAIPYVERDDPRHMDHARLGADLAALRAGRSVRVPVWSYQTHRREGERDLPASRIIVCEGIHALAPAARPHIDIAVLVRASRATRWQRWERLETSGERGWGVAEAQRYFDLVAEPTFAARAAAYHAAATYVVVND